MSPDYVFLTSSSFLGMVQVTYDIIRKEGAMSLWTGVGPAITRHYIYTGIRMGAYEVLREAVYDKEVIFFI